MPAKKTAAKTDETPDIEQAGLDELAQISMKAACDVTRGIITPKEGNAIWRRVGKRLETLEQERRSHRAAREGQAMSARPRDLPEYAAPHMARVRLVRELTRLQPATMQQIMDDHYTREAYEASIAEIPATPGRTDL